MLLFVFCFSQHVFLVYQLQRNPVKILGVVSNADILYNFNENWHKLDDEYSSEIVILNRKSLLQFALLKLQQP